MDVGVVIDFFVRCFIFFYTSIRLEMKMKWCILVLVVILKGINGKRTSEEVKMS